MMGFKFRSVVLALLLVAIILAMGCAVPVRRKVGTAPEPVLTVETVSSAGMLAKIQNSEDEIWVEGNLDVLDEGYAADVVIHRLQAPDIVGLDDLKKDIEATRSLFSDCRVIVHELIVEGDKRVAQWSWEGTSSGPANVIQYTFRSEETGESQSVDIPIPVGTKLSLGGCSVNRIVDGKVAERWHYSDSLIVPLQKMGIIVRTEWRVQ